MLITEINSIGEKAFYEFQLKQTIDVIDALEKINWSDIKDNNLRENIDFYSTLLDIVNDKVANNGFTELSDDAERKSYLLLRILRIRTNISQYRLLFLREEVETKIFDHVESAEIRFKETEKKINLIVDTAESNIKQMSTNTEASINKHLQKSETDFEQKLERKITDATNKIEPQMITTVLTLMGVFSAVITIIMSVVITSSSWLNNANGASAVLAFIIPNFVVISAIVVLLGMVFAKKQPEIVVVSGRDWAHPNAADKALKKAKIMHRLTAFMIFLFAAITAVLSLNEIKTTDELHMRYVLSQGVYECKKIPATEDTPEVVLIEFQINEKNYTVPYKEEYFHDGKLYFCEEHQRLE